MILFALAVRVAFKDSTLVGQMLFFIIELAGLAIVNGDFENNLPIGVCKMFHCDGKLKYEGMLKNGKPHGPGQEYDEKGQLKFVGNYENGEVTGSDTKLYSNGKLMNSGTYSKGGKLFTLIKNRMGR